MRKNSVARPAELSRHRAAVAENPNSSRAHFKLGSALVKSGFLGEGQAALERALELDPESVEAWVNLGGARLARWDFAGCVEANQRALDCSPDLVQAHFNQGLGYMYLGDGDRMVACFEKVLELDPANPAGYYYLAVGLRELGQIGEAQTNLAKAIGLGHSPDPSFVKALEQEDKASQSPVQILELGPRPEEAEADEDG